MNPRPMNLVSWCVNYHVYCSPGSRVLIRLQGRPLNIDPYAEPDSPVTDDFTSSSYSSESNDFGYASPFLYSDSPSAMTIPDPYSSVQYSPTPITRGKQSNRWNRTITRLTSFARRRF